MLRAHHDDHPVRERNFFGSIDLSPFKITSLLSLDSSLEFPREINLVFAAHPEEENFTLYVIESNRVREYPYLLWEKGRQSDYFIKFVVDSPEFMIATKDSFDPYKLGNPDVVHFGLLIFGYTSKKINLTSKQSTLSNKNRNF